MRSTSRADVSRINRTSSDREYYGAVKMFVMYVERNKLVVRYGGSLLYKIKMEFEGGVRSEQAINGVLSIAPIVFRKLPKCVFKS